MTRPMFRTQISSQFSRGLAGVTLAAGMAFSGAAGAFEPSAMTADEKAAFGEAVRDYLLENPEVMIEVFNVLETRQAAAAATSDQELIATLSDEIFDDGHSWVGGNPDGDVTMVEFMDYRCGYCKRAYSEVENLLESDGNIRFIVKEFPILGPQSELAARFAISVKSVAGDAAYGKVHDTLMTLRGDITDEALRRVAEDEALDVEAVMAGMNSDAVNAVLEENYALAQRLNISGTPAFVIGDEMMRGYAPEATMAEVVAGQRG